MIQLMKDPTMQKEMQKMMQPIMKMMEQQMKQKILQQQKESIPPTESEDIKKEGK